MIFFVLIRKIVVGVILLKSHSFQVKNKTWAPMKILLFSKTSDETFESKF